MKKRNQNTGNKEEIKTLKGTNNRLNLISFFWQKLKTREKSKYWNQVNAVHPQRPFFSFPLNAKTKAYEKNTKNKETKHKKEIDMAEDWCRPVLQFSR